MTSVTNDPKVKVPEQIEDEFEAAAKAVAALLDAFGVDEGDHTERTPVRVAKAWSDMLAGYREDPREHLKVTFSAPSDPGLIVVHGIRVTSTCAHHMLPIVGTASVAYRPSAGDKVVGLSKLARVVHGYARRFQVQEQLTEQVAEAIAEELNPEGALVMVTATHDCMRLRGVGEQESQTTTVARKGLMVPEDETLVREMHLRSLH